MASAPLLPLFALPGTVFFPHSFLRLHVFEPRYRQLVRDAAAANGQIGVISYDLTQGDDYDEADRLHTIGTIGVIEHLRPYADGRFDIALRGLRRFALRDLEPGKPYRLGRVQWLDERAGVSQEVAREKLPQLRSYLTYLDPAFGKLEVESPHDQSPDELFVVLANSLLGLLDLAYPQNQQLLEIDAAAGRLAQLGQDLPHQMLLSRLIGELQKHRERLELQDPILN